MYTNKNYRYEELFKDIEDKAAAFDQIAEHYYKGNFGQMQKSDFETLLFSIYIEQILKYHESEMSVYSDYNLSKELGITQTKISNLKVKKQLQYPYEQFDWKKSFLRICNNAYYDNGRIVLNIPDKNLFIEIQNWIEENNGFVDIQLNSKLLKVAPEYYIDLLLTVVDEDDAESIKNQLFSGISKKIKINNEVKEGLIGDALTKSGSELTIDIIADIFSNISHISNENVKDAIKKAGNLLKKIYKEHVKNRNSMC